MLGSHLGLKNDEEFPTLTLLHIIQEYWQWRYYNRNLLSWPRGLVMTAPVSFFCLKYFTDISLQLIVKLTVLWACVKLLFPLPFEPYLSVKPWLEVAIGIEMFHKATPRVTVTSPTLYLPIRLRDCKQVGIFDVSSSFPCHPSQLGLICRETLSRQKITLYLSCFLFSFHE